MLFDKILEDGILVSNNKYIKIIKVLPINYELKSDLEKEAILNSYKLFLKVCDFDIQILIQSRKESLDSYISQIRKQIEEEKNEKIFNVSNFYINFKILLPKIFIFFLVPKLKIMKMNLILNK